MKRVKIFACIAILLLSVFSFSGCLALKAANQAKEMLAEYYDYYNDEDIDECIDMFGDEIIDDIGDDDLTEVIFNSRRYLQGEIDEYDIVSYDSNSNFGEAEIVLKAEVQYENEEDITEEEYIFHLDNGKMEIIGIDIPDYPVADSLIDDYFKKYYDMSYAKKRYIPYVVDNFFDEESISALADSAKAAGGEYVEYDITDFTYYYDKQVNWSDDIYYLAKVEAELEFENEDFLLYAEISSEDEDVKFNYLEYYPKKAYEVIEEYYDNLSKGDTDKIINMYAPEFFEYSDVTGDEWETLMLQAMANDYGNFVDYAISGWEYSQVDINGTSVDVYSFYISTEFEAAYFNEYITVIKDKNNEAIVGHQIY